MVLVRMGGNYYTTFFELFFCFISKEGNVFKIYWAWKYYGKQDPEFRDKNHAVFFVTHAELRVTTSHGFFRPHHFHLFDVPRLYVSIGQWSAVLGKLPQGVYWNFDYC